MSETRDGGPAFPSQPHRMMRVDADGTATPLDFEGMTLRDWFAGQAMAGFVSGAASDTTSMGGIMSAAEEAGCSIHKLFAKASYEAADAMLAARTPPTS